MASGVTSESGGDELVSYEGTGEHVVGSFTDVATVAGNDDEYPDVSVLVSVKGVWKWCDDSDGNMLEAYRAYDTD